ncbi:hypothetical protein FACS1894218_0770 [Bacilli bacterium]|nr:hypothetical protein FACS1894218_0770 [Bacilli bacterium]
MFNVNVIHPVDYFNDTLVTNQLKNIDEVFQHEVMDKCKIDIAANKETADQIRSLDTKIEKVSKSSSVASGGMVFLRIFGAILFGVGVLFVVLGALNYFKPMAAFIGGGVGGITVGATIFGLS